MQTELVKVKVFCTKKFTLFYTRRFLKILCWLITIEPTLILQSFTPCLLLHRRAVAAEGDIIAD